MDLTPYIESLQRDLAASAAPGGAEVTRAAELRHKDIPELEKQLAEAKSGSGAQKLIMSQAPNDPT